MGLVGKLFRGDRSIWIIFMFLCLISLVEVYSASSTLAYKNTYFWTPIVRHATFLSMGFGIVLLIHNIPSKYYSAAIILLPISFILLLLTQIIGIALNDAHRFLSIMGVSFQPSELGKLACIVFVAFMLSKQQHFEPNVFFRTVWITVGLICLLIFPGNLSTAALLFSVCFLMMILGRAPWKKMLKLLALLALSGVIALTILQYMPKKPKVIENLFGRNKTWTERISDYNKSKSKDKFFINDDNRQVAYAKIAIANGGLSGKLPGRSVQRDFLPQAYDDFIYAIIIEEMGLILGGVGVMMLYVFLMFRVGVIARRCEKLFPKYLALGCGLLIVIQAFIHMAVSVNLAPVTGQPLPLISRGGTSTLITCFYFGFILGVSRFGAGMDQEDDTEEQNVEETTAVILPPDIPAADTETDSEWAVELAKADEETDDSLAVELAEADEEEA